ncbi:MAG: Fur family transcriptional regulator [Dehalococcoidales bacterium]|nr:Fur family transcriptional regulator [Dehalococcoidales bacterium]
MRLTKRKVVNALRQHGYKLTPQRRAVIGVIASSRDHLTPATIYAKVHQAHPNIGLVTVYRTLEILAELGLVCELHSGGICHSYTISAPQHHHHLICSSCGTVFDFTSHSLGELEQSLARQSGFRIDGHLLEFFGLCRVCRGTT